MTRRGRGFIDHARMRREEGHGRIRIRSLEEPCSSLRLVTPGLGLHLGNT
jgi:hypothetical protein